jgi:uncharacterized protein YndB with AHSA1/START domain
MGHVSYSEEISAPPEQVWTILADVTRLPDWAYKDGRFPYPVEGKIEGEQQEGVGMRWVGVSTDGQTATQKITVWEPNQKLAYEPQEMANAPLQMAQTSTFMLEPSTNGTKVTWAVDWELTSGFSLSKLLIWFTGNSAFEEMIAGSLENLKVLAESEAAAASDDDAPAEAQWSPRCARRALRLR